MKLRLFWLHFLSVTVFIQNAFTEPFHIPLETHIPTTHLESPEILGQYLLGPDPTTADRFVARIQLGVHNTNRLYFVRDYTEQPAPIKEPEVKHNSSLPNEINLGFDFTFTEYFDFLVRLQTDYALPIGVKIKLIGATSLDSEAGDFSLSVLGLLDIFGTKNETGETVPTASYTYKTTSATYGITGGYRWHQRWLGYLGLYRSDVYDDIDVLQPTEGYYKYHHSIRGHAIQYDINLGTEYRADPDNYQRSFYARLETGYGMLHYYAAKRPGFGVGFLVGMLF